MITADNYFDEIPAILDRLPSEVKDAHELVSAMKNDGIDNPFKTGDADIDSMGELLLEKANSILAKAEKKESRAAKPKPINEMEQGVIDRYPKATKKLAEKRKKQADKKEAQAPKKTFKRAVKKRNTVGLNQRKTKKGKTISRKSAQKITRKAIKQVRKSDAQKPSVTKKIFTKELQIIKAFIANDKKEVSVGVLKAKHAAVKNALKDGKTNQHQETLRNISVRYGKAIGAIKGTATHIKCNIEKSFILKLKDIVVGAKIKVRTDVLGGMMNDVITCKKCNWKWNYEDGGNDPYVCHHCGYDNANGLSGVKKLTLKQYLNQKNPSRDIEVYLKPNQVSVYNGHVTTVTITDKEYVKRFPEISHTYLLKDYDNILYVVRDNGKHDETVFRYDKPAKK